MRRPGDAYPRKLCGGRTGASGRQLARGGSRRRFSGGRGISARSSKPQFFRTPSSPSPNRPPARHHRAPPPRLGRDAAREEIRGEPGLRRLCQADERFRSLVSQEVADRERAYARGHCGHPDFRSRNANAHRGKARKAGLKPVPSKGWADMIRKVYEVEAP